MKKINDHIDNESLFEEIKKGNREAFTYLFDNYYDALYRYIFSFTKDTQQTEDIVQDAMITIWNNRRNINTKQSLKSYLYRIAHNQFIDEYRKNKVRLNYIDEVKKTALDYFIENNDEVITYKKEKLIKEIENLPPKCKEVFLLNKKNGLKYKEVAEELNISIKTVEIHISKALKILRKKFKQ